MWICILRGRIYLCDGTIRLGEIDSPYYFRRTEPPNRRGRGRGRDSNLKLPMEKLADFRREYLGFIFQSFQLIPYLTVIENVMLPLSITEKSNREQLNMAEEILEKMGLKGKGKRLPDQLSGGEQERVAIARALVNSPPILLADEPTGNLDSKTGKEIMELFKSLNEEGTDDYHGHS